MCSRRHFVTSSSEDSPKAVLPCRCRPMISQKQLDCQARQYPCQTYVALIANQDGVNSGAKATCQTIASACIDMNKYLWAIATCTSISACNQQTAVSENMLHVSGLFGSRTMCTIISTCSGSRLSRVIFGSAPQDRSFWTTCKWPALAPM